MADSEIDEMYVDCCTGAGYDHTKMKKNEEHKIEKGMDWNDSFAVLERWVM